MQQNQVNWILNIGAGTWTSGPTETSPEAESSSNQLSNNARVLDCTSCSGDKSVGYVGGTSSPGGTITFPNISSNSGGWTTIRVHATNGDKGQRYANVIVNGQSQVLAFLPTKDGNSAAASVLNVQLNQGSGNTIRIEGVNAGWGMYWFPLLFR